MADLSTEIKIGADASGVEAGVSRAKRSLDTLGASASKVGKGGRDSIELLGVGGDKAAKKVEQATKNMQGSIQRLIAEQKAGAKGSREYYEALADSRGISRSSLKPLLDDLDAAKRKTDAAKNSADDWRTSLAKLDGVAIGAAIGAAAVGIAAMVKQTIDGADAFSKLSAKSGIAVESLRELNYAASLSDVSTDSLATGVRKLSQNMAAAAGGAKLQTAAFDAVGVSIYNLDGSLKGADQMVKELASKFATFKDGPEKAALAIELFGKQGAELIPLLNGGAAGLADMAEEANRLGIVFDGDLAKNAEAFNDNLTRIQTGVEGAAVAITKELLPTLNNLAQAFVDADNGSQGFASTVGGAVRTVLETVTISAANVVFVLKGMGREIGAIAAQGAALARLDFDGFTAISDAVKEDGVRARAELDKFQFDLLNARFLNSSAGAGRGGTSSTDPRSLGIGSTTVAPVVPTVPTVPTVPRIPKETLSDYDKLIQKLGVDMPAAAAAAEAAQLGYNKSQTVLHALMASPAWAKFTEDQRANVTALYDNAIASEQAADSAKALAKANLDAAVSRDKYLVSLDAGLDKIQADIAAQIDATQRMGMSKEAIAELDAAKLEMLATDLELQAIKAMDRNLDEATYAALKKQAAAYRELAKAKQQGAAKEVALDLEEANTKAAEKASAEWQKTADSINQSLTDALMRGFESGKDFAKNLRDTVINMFKTMILRPVISAIISPVGMALGGLGASGAANAATGGTSALGSLGSLGVLGGAFGTGMAASFTSMWAAGISGWATAAGSLIGTGTAAGVAAGLGMIAAPLLALAVLWKPLFGRKLKDSGIQGTFGGESGFEGEEYEFYQGGLFRSDKTKTKPINDELRKFLGDAFNAMKVQVTDFADALGLSTERLEGYTSTIKISTKGLDEDKAKAKIAEALATVNNELAEQVLGSWKTTTEKVKRQVQNSFIDIENGADQYRTVEEDVTTSTYTPSEFAKDGEKAIDTLARLATSLTVVNAIFDTLGYTLLEGSLAGGDLASKLADVFGGLDKLTESLGSYYQNFYSEEERRATAKRQLEGELGKLGFQLPKTREEYRKLVEAQDLNTEAGRKAYAILVQLSGVFAEITESADDAAAAAQRVADEMAAKRREAIDKAYRALQNSVAEQRGQLAIQQGLAQESIDTLTKVFDLVSDNARELFNEVAEVAVQSAEQGRRYIDDALLASRAGYAPDANGLSLAIAAARGGLDATAFQSQFDKDAATLELANKLQDLGELTDAQLDTAGRTLKGINQQIEQLDQTLEYWKQQIDIANGTYEATISLVDAVKALDALLRPKEPDKPGKPAGGGAVFGGTSPGTAPRDPLPPAKYNRPAYYGTAGIGTTAVRDPDVIAHLDSLYDLYHSFDGTGDLVGLLTSIKGAGGTLDDLVSLSGYWLKDWHAAAASVGIPAFAKGGYHKGGYAMVGENGPELAYMPPARIYTAQDTRALMGGGDGGRTQELLSQLIAENRDQGAQIVRMNKRMAKVFEKWDGDGLPQPRVEDATA